MNFDFVHIQVKSFSEHYIQICYAIYYMMVQKAKTYIFKFIFHIEIASISIPRRSSMWLLLDKSFSNNHWFKKWKICHLDTFNYSFLSKWSFPNSCFEGRLVKRVADEATLMLSSSTFSGIIWNGPYKTKGEIQKDTIFIRRNSNLPFYFSNGSKS